MPSSFTEILNLEIMAAGENENVWAPKDELNKKKMERAAGGYLSKSVAGASNVSMTATEAENHTIVLTGTLTGSISIIMPDKKRRWWMTNNTTGNFVLNCKTKTGLGIPLSKATQSVLFSDGTNVNQFDLGIQENLIINGGMRVAQRGSTTISDANVHYGAVDRFVTIAGQTPTSLSIDQETAPVAGLSSTGYALKFNNYQAGAPAATARIKYRMESRDAEKLSYQPLTLTFTVYHTGGAALDLTTSWRTPSTADDFSATVPLTSVGGESAGGSAFAQIADSTVTYVYDSVRLAGDTSKGLELDMYLTINDTASAHNYFFADVQLVVGAFQPASSATLRGIRTTAPYLTFREKSFVDTFNQCLRYAYQVDEGASGEYVSAGAAVDGTSAHVVIPHPTPMRADPTITFTAGSFDIQEIATARTLSALAASNGTETETHLDFTTTTSMTAGSPAFLISGGGAGKILFDAEL